MSANTDTQEQPEQATDQDVRASIVAEECDSSKLPRTPMARRSFMRRTAISAAALATASSGTALAEGDEEDTSNWDYVRDGTNGVYMLLTGRYATRAIGNYQDAADEVLHEGIYSTAREIEEDRQNAFDSIENDLTMLSGWIRDNVANEMANVAAADGTIDDMHDAAKDVVRDNIANTEQNLFNVWATDIEKTAKAVYEVDNNAYYPDPHFFMTGQAQLDGGIVGTGLHDLNDDAYDVADTYDPWVAYHLGEVPEDTITGRLQNMTFSLANGDQITIPAAADLQDNDPAESVSLLPFAEASNLSVDQPEATGVGGGEMWPSWDDLPYKMTHMNEFEPSAFDGYDYGHDDFKPSEGSTADVRVSVYPYDAVEDDRAELIDAQRFAQAHRDLLDLLEEELSNAETIVDNLGQAMLDGEVSYHDVASGQAVLDAAADLEDWNDAAMFFRQVNTPEGEHAAIVELESGVELQGALFWTAPDPENGLPVGEWLNPTDDLVGEIHMGAEVYSLDGYDGDDWGEDWVGTTKLSQPFKIVGLDGGHDGPLMFDETELPDPQDTEAMLERIRDAYEREQEAKDDTDRTVSLDVESPFGGSGGLSDVFSGLNSIGIVAGIAAIIYALGSRN